MLTIRLSAALMILSLVIGCAQTEKGAESPKPTAGGSSSATSETPSLVGSWVLDMEAMKQTPKFLEQTPEQQQQMLALLGMMVVSFDFSEDTITSKMGFMGQIEETFDKYRILEANDSNFKIESTDANGKVTVIDAKLDGDQLELSNPDDGVFFLKRQ